MDRVGEIVSIVLLPGPPKEMKAMFEAQCLPRLIAMLPPLVIRTRFYRVAGMPESDLDQLIAPVTRVRESGDDDSRRASRHSDSPARPLRDRRGSRSAAGRSGAQIEPLLGDRLYTCTGSRWKRVSARC